MRKKKNPIPRTPADDSTGTYVFDKKLGKVVKVSSRIPAVAAKGKDGSESDGAPSLPCGRDSCDSNACGMGGGFGDDF